MDTKDMIRRLRTEKGLSQDELAEKLFVTRQAVSRWENGETTPNTETLKQLSRLFDVSINTLLGAPRQLVCQCCGMPLEDAAMYLSIPETTVLDPADYAQLECITRQLPGITKGVTYTRFVRKGIVKVYEDGSEFPIGKGIVLHESDKDVATIITSGIMVDESLKAYEALQAEGISVRVIDMFTWKPLDEQLILDSAAECGAIVTAENHQVKVGLGSAVANVVIKNNPVPMEMVGVEDRFGQVGAESFLREEYGLTAAHIVEAAKKAIARKNG